MKALGRHVLTEFCGCNREVLNNKEFIKDCMENATVISGAEVVKSMFHTFNQKGVSGVVVTSESQIAIHTWPEYGYAAIDLFICSEVVDPWKAYRHLKEQLGAGDISTMEVKRGQLDVVSKGITRKSAGYLLNLGGGQSDH